MRQQLRTFFTKQYQSMVHVKSDIECAMSSISAILEYMMFREWGPGQRGGTNFSQLKKKVGHLMSELVTRARGAVGHEQASRELKLGSTRMHDRSMERHRCHRVV